MGERRVVRPRTLGKMIMVLLTSALVAGACGDDDDVGDSVSPSSPGGSVATTAVETTGETETTGATEPTGGESETTDGETPSTEAETPTSAAAPDFEYDPEGVLRVGADLASTQLDPNDDTGLPAPSGFMQALIYGRLLREGATSGRDDVLPGLITEWEAPDDNTLELTFVEGAMFSDGTPFTADAVKFSWDRCKNDDGFKLDLFVAYEESEVVDDTHLIVRLNRPFAGVWIDYMLKQNVYCMAIVSPAAVEEFGDAFKDNPVGAGPYMVETIETDQRVVLVPNPNYHNPAEQTFARVEFIQTAAGPGVVTALASGQVDIASATALEVEALEGAGLNIATRAGSILTELEMCPTKAPIDTPDARRAILHAIDTEAINEIVFQGRNTAARQLTPPDFPYYSEVGAEENVFDLDKADELAQSSGLAGQSIDLMYFSPAPQFAPMAEVLQSQLAEIDVTVNLVPTQNPFADKNSQQPHLNLWGYFPQSIQTGLSPGQINNYCGIDIPEINAAIEQLWVADIEVAQQAFDDLQAAVNDEVPMIPLNLGDTVYAYTDSVVGEVVIPNNGFWFLDWEKIGMAP